MLPNIVTGKIFKKGFKDIWTDDKNWDIWRSNKLNGKCSQCKYGAACRGGCKAMSFYKYERTDIPDPRCIGPF